MGLYLAFANFLREVCRVPHGKAEDGESWISDSARTMERAVGEDQVGDVVTLPPAVGYELLGVVAHAAGALSVNLTAGYRR